MAHANTIVTVKAIGMNKTIDTTKATATTKTTVMTVMAMVTHIIAVPKAVSLRAMSNGAEW